MTLEVEDFGILVGARLEVHGARATVQGQGAVNGIGVLGARDASGGPIERRARVAVGLQQP